MITLADIRKATSPMSYTKGNVVYKGGEIKDLEYHPSYPNITVANGTVVEKNGDKFESSISYCYEDNAIVKHRCECSESLGSDLMCKHCVALALKYYYDAIEHSELDAGIAGSGSENEIKIKSDKEIRDLIYSNSMKDKAKYFQPAITGNVEVIPYLYTEPNNKMSVEFKIGIEQLYVIKDLSQFANDILQGNPVTYGKKLSFIHELSAFTALSQKMVNYIVYLVEKETEKITAMNNNSIFDKVAVEIKKRVILDEKMLSKLYFVLEGQKVEISSQKLRIDLCNVLSKDYKIKMELSQVNDDCFALKLPPINCVGDGKRVCIRHKDDIYCCSHEFSTVMEDILDISSPNEENSYIIARDDMKSFCQAVLPKLDKYASVVKSDEISIFEPEPCKIKIYIDDKKDIITCTLYADYGGETFNMLLPIAVGDLFRDILQERKAVNVAMAYFDKIDDDISMFSIPKKDDDKIYQLLSTGIMQLRQCGELYVAESIKNIQILKQSHVKVGVSVEAGLLDLKIDANGMSSSDIEGILNSYRLKKKFYKLESGEYLQLENGGITAIAQMTEGMDIDNGSIEEGHLQIPLYRAYYVDDILREEGMDIEVKREQSFKSLIRNMKDVEDSDFDVSQNLNASLRPYQKFGYRWLRTLSGMGFGGILADDMGLGKTIQVISFLLSLKDESDKPIKALIVCPASLVYNWENEIMKFAPTLNISTVVGNAQERKQLLNDDNAEVFLTSYDYLKRDLDEYSNLQFDYMIIDEAQNIKNHKTISAKAVKAVNSGIRFALTGTPIENTLSELWSIFEFLMPGILQTYASFKQNYEQPISEGDKFCAERLRKLIRPYILRRIKKDVLKELPDKIEETIYSKMEGEQLDIYKANVLKIQNSLKTQTDEEFKRGKIEILAELTKLRQICCDPSLIFDEYKGESAKMDTCMELISSAVESGNKILLFSQFTSMFDIMIEKFREMGISYYCLTGATSKEKRREMVDAFNEDDTSVFLISLKAGGTGLNLTSASVVIHYDPWWNIAAQNQATDRAYRIGQKQIVNVYKLITKNTLEEKIQNLQEKKAMLSDEIISEGGIKESIATKDEFMELINMY